MWRRCRPVAGFTTRTAHAQETPVRWRTSRRRRPSQHRHRPDVLHAFASSPVRDPAGMVVPEALLRARRISPSRFDRTLAAAAASIVGPDMEDGDNSTHADRLDSHALRLGAQLDSRQIHYRGRHHEAQLFLSQSPTLAPSSSPPRASPATGPTSTSPKLRMESVREDVNAPSPTGAHAYLRTTGRKTSSGRHGDDEARDAHPSEPDNKKSASTSRVPAANRTTTVELDDGEKVATPAASLSILQRLLRRGHGENSVFGLAAASESVEDRHTVAAVPAGRRQQRAQRAVTRERRRDRAVDRQGVHIASQQHPCRLQGGGCLSASASGASSACALTQYPSVCCLAQLQHGYCALRELHCCPWHHGEVAHHRRQSVLAEALFALDPSDSAMAALLTDHIPQQAPLATALLQLFVDLLVVRLEGVEGEVCVEALFAAHTNNLSTVDVTESVNLWAHASHCEGVPLSLCVARGVALTALEMCQAPPAPPSSTWSAGTDGDAEPNTAHLAADGAMADSFEAMWRAEEVRAMGCTSAQLGDHGYSHALAEEHAEGVALQFLQDTACLWSSFFHVSGDEVRLSPWLTSWALQEAQRQSRPVTDIASTAEQGKAASPSVFFPACSSPSSAVLFQSAAAHLIETRTHHCDGRWDAFTRGDDKSHTGGASDHATPYQCWAPLLLVKDCLLLQACPGVSLASAEAVLENASLHGHTTNSSEQPQRGSVFTDVLLAYTESDGGSVLQRAREGLTYGWHNVHRVLLTAVCGLAQEANPPAARLTSQPSGASARDFTGSLSLLSFTQPALLGLASHCCTVLGQRYEDRLRRERGWAPWTDAVLFDASGNPMYGPGAYVRHHCPVIASSCLNALLNAFLLATSQATLYHCGLESASPFVDAMGLSAGFTAAVPAVVPVRSGSRGLALWIRSRRARRHRHRMAADLQREVQVSLGFVNALQALSDAVLAEQAALKQAYEQRLYTHKRDHADAARAADHRVRKYHQTQLSDVVEAVDEAVLHEPVLDRLLPYGSAAASPQAVAALLRLLLESKHSAFKALRLSVSLMRVGRLLRHAAALPAAVRVDTTKRVHRRVWSKKLNKKVLVTTRVPVVRWERPEAFDARHAAALAEAERGAKLPGQGVRQHSAAVQPVGLLFRVDEQVAVEVCRSGLRMGEAGLALADGLRSDCFAGGMADYAQDRCLPVADLEMVSHILHAPLRLTTARLTVPLDAAQDGVEQCLRVAGLARSTTRSSSSSSAVAGLHHHLQHSIDDLSSSAGAAVVGRRIVPTALLMEVLESHTPAEDASRHTAYDVQWCRDQARFTQLATVFARHLSVARRQPLWALQAYEAVWVSFVQQQSQRYANPASAVPTASSFTCPSSSSALAAWRAVAQEANARFDDVSVLLDDARAVRRKGTTQQAAGAGQAGSVDQVKALLTGGVPDKQTEREDLSAPRSGKRRQGRLSTQNTAGTPGARYELRLYEDWLQASQQVEILGALSAATIATATAPVLVQSVHKAASTARLALLHVVLLSTDVTRQATAPALLTRACQCLLLSPMLKSDDRDEVQEPLDEVNDKDRGVGDWLWSGRSVVVRTLPLFLALQVALWETTPQTAPAADHAKTLIGTLRALPAVAGLLQQDVRTHAAWTFVKPLSAYPDLAAHWLHATLFEPSPPFAAWLLAQCDDKDRHTRAALTAWLQAAVPTLAEILTEGGPSRSPDAPPKR